LQKKKTLDTEALPSNLNKGNARRGICPPSGKLSESVLKIRFREKWNMVKIDEPQ
jgi:hypothetical protein